MSLFAEHRRAIINKLSHVVRFTSSRETSTAVNIAVDSVQAEYLNEPCIAVTEEDEPIAQISKLECHRADKAILHRAFSAFLFDPHRRLLLQKRAAIKITFPERWTNTCCSHPLYTEDEMDMNCEAIGIKRAAQRKLDHELGIKGLPTDKMHVMGRFLYKAMSDDKWGEHEIDYAVVVPNFQLPFDANPTEVADWRFVDREDLQAMVASGTAFSPWFSLFLQHKWLYQWWDNLDRLPLMTDLQSIHRLN
jgi:isopentenyl-diphosphate delta-isomerase